MAPVKLLQEAGEVPGGAFQEFSWNAFGQALLGRLAGRSVGGSGGTREATFLVVEGVGCIVTSKRFRTGFKSTLALAFVGFMFLRA